MYTEADRKRDEKAAGYVSGLNHLLKADLSSKINEIVLGMAPGSWVKRDNGEVWLLQFAATGADTRRRVVDLREWSVYGSSRAQTVSEAEWAKIALAFAEKSPLPRLS